MAQIRLHFFQSLNDFIALVLRNIDYRALPVLTTSAGMPSMKVVIYPQQVETYNSIADIVHPVCWVTPFTTLDTTGIT